VLSIVASPSLESVTATVFHMIGAFGVHVLAGCRLVPWRCGLSGLGWGPGALEPAGDSAMASRQQGR